MEANPPTTTIDISEAWQECDEKGQNLQNREPQIAKCRREEMGGPSAVSSKKTFHREGYIQTRVSGRVVKRLRNAQITIESVATR